MKTSPMLTPPTTFPGPRATTLTPLILYSYKLFAALARVKSFAIKQIRTLCQNTRGLTTFRINTCKSVTKQTTLTLFGMNTYAKPRGRGSTRLSHRALFSGCPHRGAELLCAGQIRLAVAHLVIPGDFDLDLTVGVRGPARSRVVGKAVLGTQLAVDAVENAVQLCYRIGKEHGATHSVGN